MSCYHPMLGVRCGTTDNGKPKYVLNSFTDGVLNKFPHQDVVLIPCGKCLGCRLEYAKKWSDRIIMESKCHDSNYFVTLTYDDSYVPVVENNGVFLDTLCKKDVQDFMKRLRKYMEPEKIRFYLCGEYGSSSYRPHYHAIIFGLRLPDVTEKTGAKSVNGDPILESQILTKIWGKGFVELGSVTANSASYVARYVLKKAREDQTEDFKVRGQEPEFSLMSRKPAIGRPYFDAHPEMFALGASYVATDRGSVKIMPDRYFKNLTEGQTEKAKNLAKSKIIRENKEKISQLQYSKILNNEEINKKSKINILQQRTLKK